MTKCVGLRASIARVANVGCAWVALSVVALLAACGGGSETAMAPLPPPPQAQQPAAGSTPLRQADASLTPDEAMDWAEAHYPDLFPAANRSAGYQAPYNYRFYASTNNYIGVSTGQADVAVYIYGNVANWQITRMGALSDYTCTVKPAACPALSPNIAFWGDSIVPPVEANLAYLMPGRTFFDGGVSSQSSTQVTQRMVADTAKHNWVSIYWAGHNNDSDPAQVKADIAQFVANLSPGNNRFVIVSILNKAIATELKGTAMYNTIIQLNADLAAAYPGHFVDARAMLVAHYNPAIPQDVIDHGNDVMPSSLRHDEDHLNNDGSVLVAEQLRDFLNAKGW